jgi:hypothetical protein
VHLVLEAVLTAATDDPTCCPARRTSWGEGAAETNCAARCRALVKLLEQSHRQAVVTGPSTTADDEAKIQKAIRLVEQGEPSHAARVLHASALAPGNQPTLDELHDPRL